MTAHMLTALRARHESIRTAIQAVTDTARDERRDLTEDELRSVADQGAEAHRIGDSIEHLQSEQVRVQHVSDLNVSIGAGLGAGVSLGAPGSSAYADLGGGESVPPLMPSPDQVAEMFRAATGDATAHRWTVEHTRAAITTTNTGTTQSLGSGGSVLRQPRRIATAVPLTVERVEGVQGLAYPVFGAGAADIAAEGAVKPEYAAVTPGTAVPQMISVWSDVQRQALLSMPAFESRLRAKHAALLAKREDLLMVARLQGATGVQTVTATASQPYSDVVLAAAGLVLSSDVAAEPDIILCNPADLPQLFPGATSTGASGESPVAGLRLDMHGALVYPTAAVAAGAGIVAALGAATRFVLGLAPTVLVDSMSQLKSNKVTILTEEAVSLAIDEPSGIVIVDFTA
jgi:hypothetical protein